MKSKSFKNWLLILGGTVILITSCEKDDPEPDITANNMKGMFIVCEGNFGSGDGDITFHTSDPEQTIKKLYYSVNDVPLGDVVQSFEVVDTLGFIAVNNSQKVTIVNMKDFTEVRTIYGFSYPRSIVRADQNTVYVSNGNGFSDNYIYSIDLTTLEKTDSLEVTTGPEKMIPVGSKVYAAIAGGWNNDGNTIIEIDPLSFTILNTYEVGQVPVDIVADRDNNIWTYCKGIPDYTNYPDVTYSGMGICKIEISSGEVTTLPFTSMSAPGINNIAAGSNGSTVYYLNDGLYSMDVTATSLPDTKTAEGSYYGLDVDPDTGNIVCLDATGSEAVILNSAGEEQSRIETADFPNSVLFGY